MTHKVTLHNVKKHKSVYSSKEIGVNTGFKNTRTIPKGEKGEIISNGFEQGQLKVNFYNHFAAPCNQLIEFNLLSAENYLLTDGFYN